MLHQWVQRKNNVINVKKKQKTEHGRVTSTDAILAFAVKHFTLFKHKTHQQWQDSLYDILNKGVICRVVAVHCRNVLLPANMSSFLGHFLAAHTELPPDLLHRDRSQCWGRSLLRFQPFCWKLHNKRSDPQRQSVSSWTRLLVNDGSGREFALEPRGGSDATCKLLLISGKNLLKKERTFCCFLF